MCCEFNNEKAANVLKRMHENPTVDKHSNKIGSKVIGFANDLILSGVFDVYELEALIGYLTNYCKNRNIFSES